MAEGKPAMERPEFPRLRNALLTVQHSQACIQTWSVLWFHSTSMVTIRTQHSADTISSHSHFLHACSCLPSIALQATSNPNAPTTRMRRVSAWLASTHSGAESPLSYAGRKCAGTHVLKATKSVVPKLDTATHVVRPLRPPAKQVGSRARRCTAGTSRLLWSRHNLDLKTCIHNPHHDWVRHY